MSHVSIADLVDGDLHSGLCEFSPRGEYTVEQAGVLSHLEALAEPLTAPTFPSDHESTPIGDATIPTPAALPKDFSAVWDPESPAEKAADRLIGLFRGWFR